MPDHALCILPVSSSIGLKMLGLSLQSKDMEAKLALLQQERAVSLKENTSLKSEVARLRAQLDHTGDSQARLYNLWPLCVKASGQDYSQLKFCVYLEHGLSACLADNSALQFDPH